MKICFLNELSGLSACVLEGAIRESIEYAGIDGFVLGERETDCGLPVMVLQKIKVRYPQVRVYQLTHIPVGKVRKRLTCGFDGYWYPQGLEKHPARLARRVAGCLVIDCAEMMIDGGHGKTGLAKLLSAYGEIRKNLGMLHMVRLSGKNRCR